MRLRWSARGSALVETALVLALLGPLAFAGVTLAYGTYQIHTLEAAVTEAARFGSADASNPDRIRNVAAFGNPDGSGTPRLPGLQADQFDVTIEEEEGWPVRVKVSVRFAGVRALGGVRRLEGKPSAEFPYTGQALAASSK